MTATAAAAALLTVDELAQTWRATPATVRALISAGQLPASKIGGRWLIAPADAEAYRQARMNVRPVERRPRRRRAAS